MEQRIRDSLGHEPDQRGQRKDGFHAYTRAEAQFSISVTAAVASLVRAD